MWSTKRIDNLYTYIYIYMRPAMSAEERKGPRKKARNITQHTPWTTTGPACNIRSSGQTGRVDGMCVLAVSEHRLLHHSLSLSLSYSSLSLYRLSTGNILCNIWLFSRCRCHHLHLHFCCTDTGMEESRQSVIPNRASDWIWYYWIGQAIGLDSIALDVIEWIKPLDRILLDRSSHRIG